MPLVEQELLTLSEHLSSLNLHGITNTSISEEFEDTKEESESVN
jgi:hypothetical protein